MFPLAFFRVKKKTRINRCGGEGCCLGPQVEDTEADSRFCAVLEPEALEPYRGGWREGLRAELWRGLCGEELGRRRGWERQRRQEGSGLGSHLTCLPVQRTVCAACRYAKQVAQVGEASRLPAPATPLSLRDTPPSAHLYRGCSEVSEGDRSGMERDVEDRVVAMEAVVASSKEGGVQGRRSGRPAGTRRWAPLGARPPGLPCSSHCPPCSVLPPQGPPAASQGSQNPKPPPSGPAGPTPLALSLPVPPPPPSYPQLCSSHMELLTVPPTGQAPCSCRDLAQATPASLGPFPTLPAWNPGPWMPRGTFQDIRPNPTQPLVI